MTRGFKSIVILVAIFAAGCDHTKDTDTSRPSHFGFQTSIADSLIGEGRNAYQQYCVGCHGATGEGNGEAAMFLNPKPRNFVDAKFRFSSTRSGQLPTDEDLKRTLRSGLRGSAMPSFNLLPERTVDSLIAYIKSLSPKWREREPAPTVPVVDDPYRNDPDKSEAIRRGEAVYHGYATCWSCHPAYVPEAKVNQYLVAFDNPSRDIFRPDLFQSVGKLNDENQVVYPPDFRRDFVRAGAHVTDLYRSISAGITGTAMPTWVDSIDMPGKHPGDPPLVSRADLWAIAYYVQSLILQRPPLLAESEATVRDRPRPIYLHGEPPRSAEPGLPASPLIGVPSSQPADESFTP